MKIQKDKNGVSLLVVTLLASIFMGEMLVMVFIDTLPPMSQIQEALMDSSLLALICYPFLYYMAFTPLRNEINRHEEIEGELFASNLDLKAHEKGLEEKNFELKRINAALTESKQRFDDLFNFSPVGCLILSPDGMVLEANMTSEKLLSAERDKIVDKNFISFIPHEEYGQWALCLRNVLVNESKYSHKLIIKRQDGSVFYALMTCARGNPLVSSEIYAAFIDITHENWESFK